MPGIYEHLNFKRETKSPERRRHPAPPKPYNGNPTEHSSSLKRDIDLIKENLSTEIKGYDDRLLIKLTIEDNFSPESFESIPGIQLVSQEDKSIVLLFLTEDALKEFESRISTFGSTNGIVTRKELIQATQSFGLWSPKDRIGNTIKREGLPDSEQFILDVELWPQESIRERSHMLDAFRSFANIEKFQFLDSVNNSSITLVRVKCSRINYETILKYRDVRVVELPPRFSLDYSLFETDIADISPPSGLNDDAPKIAILDSGINASHPLLRTVVGDARNYIDSEGVEDLLGHGTPVSGIALYGDVEESIRSKRFIPYFYILSGKILHENNVHDEKFIENQIEKAVREFHSEYGCKIFNISIGDARRPYYGGRVSSLTVTLDNLSHELNVLFIVSAGNLEMSEISEKLQHGKTYPNYLLEESNILEPSNSINSITVGSVTKYDRSRVARNNPNDPAYQRLAPIDSVSPFSRVGFGIGGSIKPELMAHGGNQSIDHRSKSLNKNELGVISLNAKFIEGKLFSENIGTSLSTPYITHLAGRILANSKDYSTTFIKALLVASAEADSIKIPDLNSEEKLRLRGYGKVDEDFLFKSGEDVVVLYSTDKIRNDKNHFYEIPIPEDFFNGKKRKREITVSLAYNSSVRNTRINYRATRISFKFVKGESLEEVIKMFDKETEKEDYDNIPEYGDKKNRNISNTIRSKGTVQASTWSFVQPNPAKFYVVVTRNDFSWAEQIAKVEEEYSIVIIIKDKEQIEPKLYTKISQRIRTRVSG
ncbi:MAG: S8 family peptidase [Leptospiraceae bacterium]|jgi:hypothetical protein|nr:S8 family peptidase [Leptospiraceae bacterium]